jgi:hypothetical protein
MSLNTANDFRARLRFPRVAREPPQLAALHPYCWTLQTTIGGAHTNG